MCVPARANGACACNENTHNFLCKNERDLSLMTSLATWPASRWISDDGHIPGRRTTNCVFF